MRSLLVTNDFPPKVGGIQSYLWELWRRLPPDEVAVLTTPQAGDTAFDAAQAFPVVRTRQRVLLPTPLLARQIEEHARRFDAGLVVLDPALPLGALGPRLSRPYGIVLHGAEVTVPGRLPGLRWLLGDVLRGARTVVAAGRYPAEEGARAAGCALPTTVVPPGVDPAAFRPLDPAERAAARRDLGLPEDALVVLGLSRLVPRKGFDVLLRAAGRLASSRPRLVVAIGGSGRDRARLERVARAAGAPARFLGRVPDADMARLYGCADVFAAPCRDRWLGLEQEGFGIVFLEAAAAGTPAVAGRSGGSHEAVVDGETGLVVDRPGEAGPVADALAALLDDPVRRAAMGAAARRRAETELDYDLLAPRLRAALVAAGGAVSTPPSGPPPSGPAPEVLPGRRLVLASWIGTALFTVLAVGAAAFPDALAPASAVLDLVLFAFGFGAFCWTLLRAADRSREEELSVGGLWFLSGGSAPRSVQRDLLVPLAIQVVVGVGTAAVRPFTPLAFGILVPLYGLGLIGLWSAAHGTFVPRRQSDARRPGPSRPG